MRLFPANLAAIIIVAGAYHQIKETSQTTDECFAESCYDNNHLSMLLLLNKVNLFAIVFVE